MSKLLCFINILIVFTYGVFSKIIDFFFYFSFRNYDLRKSFFFELDFKSLYKKNYKVNFKTFYIIFLALFILSFLILLNKPFIDLAYFSCWQCINYNYLIDDLFKSIFFLQSQPPLFNFILGLVHKLSQIFSFIPYPVNMDIYPESIRSSATIFFIIFSTLVPIQFYFINEILIRVIKSKILSLFLSFLLLIAPFTLYLTTYASWEYLMSFFLVSLLYLIFTANEISSHQKIKKHLLLTCFVLIFLILLRSSIKFSFCLIVISYFFFYFDKKTVLKYLILPFLSIFLLFGFKNYLLLGSFTLETQGMIHLSHSLGPFVIYDNDFYQSLDEKEKKLFKNHSLGLRTGMGHYQDLGFEERKLNFEKYINKKKYFPKGEGNSLLMPEISNSYSKFNKHLIFNKPLREILNYIQISFFKYWEGSVVEHIEGASNIKTRKTFFKLQSNYFSIKGQSMGFGFIFLVLLSGSFINRTVLYKYNPFGKDPNIIKILYFEIIIIYLLVVTAIIPVNGNPRYREACEPLLLLYFILSAYYFFNLIIKKNYINLAPYLIISCITIIIFNQNQVFNQKISQKIIEEKNIENVEIYGINPILVNDFVYFEKDNFTMGGKDFFTIDQYGITQKPFYLAKNEFSFSDYVNYYINNNNPVYPIWWNPVVSIENNYKNFMSYIDIADYHINHNIPITGLTPKDIITIVNWYSDFYNVKASLPKSSHYDYVISLIESEELFKNVDQSLKLDDCISICLDSINSPSSEYQLNNVIGNVWEFSLPENNVNYYLDKNKGYKINHNNGNLLYDRNVYKNLSKELVHLKGGSYTSTNYGIIKGSTLIVSDDIYDKDFGFRIVLN